MKYQSRFKTALMMQEKAVRKKETEIMEINKQRAEVIRKIEKEKEKSAVFRFLLEKDDGMSSSFFVGSSDLGYARKLQQELANVEQVLQQERTVYQKLKKKKEMIEEMDKRREKEFYEELLKKEEKELQDLQTMMKYREREEEDHD